jgi:hypothetical protein
VTFKFKRYDVQPAPTYPSGVIYRPVIPIWIGAEDGPRKPYFGLLDTGSDDTKFPMSVSDRLGVLLDRDHLIAFRGVGGEAFGYFGKVTMELRQTPRTWRWSANVAFLPPPKDASPEEEITITLGHTGFLRYFHVAFDYQRGRVKIRPNRLFVGLPG